MTQRADHSSMANAIRALAMDAVEQASLGLAALSSGWRRHPLAPVLMTAFDTGFLEALPASVQSECCMALLQDALAVPAESRPFVDWLLAREGVAPTVPALREGLRHWRGGPDAAARKDRLFDDRALGIALERLTQPATALA